MDCGTSMVKYILFIFNTLVSVIGILGIVYGVILLNSIGTIDVNGHSGFPPQAAIPIVLIALGSIVVFISFLGCCGAIRESVCMTMTYAFFLLVLLILQLTIVVLLYTHKEKFNDLMGQVVDEAWERDQRDKTGVFQTLETSLKCCGKNGISDYLLRLQAPASCCPNPIAGVCTIDSYGGCREKFQSFMTGSTETAKYVGIGLIVIELVGFIFACCLANNVRNYKRRNAY